MLKRKNQKKIWTEISSDGDKNQVVMKHQKAHVQMKQIAVTH